MTTEAGKRPANGQLKTGQRPANGRPTGLTTPGVNYSDPPLKVNSKRVT